MDLALCCILAKREDGPSAEISIEGKKTQENPRNTAPLVPACVVIVGERNDMWFSVRAGPHRPDGGDER